MMSDDDSVDDTVDWAGVILMGMALKMKTPVLIMLLMLLMILYESTFKIFFTCTLIKLL